MKKRKNKIDSELSIARPERQRGYAELSGLRGGAFADWPISSLSEEADTWANNWACISRVRDMVRGDSIFSKHRESVWANVFGEHGITCRMKIKETEDRIVYAADEKKALFVHELRINRVREWAAQKEGRDPVHYRAMKLADLMDGQTRDLEMVLRGKASIQVGQPDTYANQLIEKAWLESHRAKNCDLRKSNDYKAQQQIRLWSAIRDGEHFIRKIRDSGDKKTGRQPINKFGFAMQMVNAEWCDAFLNCTLANGNEIRRGIEYQSNDWGIGEPVAYYFIKRAPRDWQFTAGAFGGTVNPAFHVRIDAREIIHYRRIIDAEGTRPAPWIASVIPLSRQLSQYHLYEVICAREAATKTGIYWSDVLPEGGMGMDTAPNPGDVPLLKRTPGGAETLPFGVKYQHVDPQHPTANFEAFRKTTLRAICAGMPGADYNSIGCDLEMISFSAGRIGKLDCNENHKSMQRHDIDVAEVDIFETWLEMAFITGAVPLPLAKFTKFNRPVFQGRRWVGVDEVKEVTAAALRMANHMSSLQKECAQNSQDFEENAFEEAEAQMILEELGVNPAFTVQRPATTVIDQGNADASEETPKPSTGGNAKPGGTKPSKKNGHDPDLDDEALALHHGNGRLQLQ